MNQRPSFFRQAFVLIDRYFHIFFNDKQNLILTLAIPLLTILIVCLVAVPDMYSVKAEQDHKINNGNPVLIWEHVVQEQEDKANGGNKEIEVKENEAKRLEDDEINEMTILQMLPSVYQKIGDEDYFLITEPSQLAALMKADEYESSEDYLRYNYILQCDIDCDGKTISPIGSNAKPFLGTFDGNAHKIFNFKMDENSNTALFARLSSAQDDSETETVSIFGNNKDLKVFHNGIVKNLEIADATIYASGENAAFVVAKAENSARVFGCTVKNSELDISGDNVGSIAGAVEGENVEVYNCYAVSCTVKGAVNVGGLVGNLDSSRLSAAYFIGTVESDTSDRVGMIAGTYSSNANDVLKNVFYRTEGDGAMKAVENNDIEDVAFGLNEEEMQRQASFLVPFKGIRTAYDIKTGEYHDDEWKKRVEETTDYNAEEDKDLDEDHSFKKDDQLAIFNGTQTGLFMLACVAVFVGICNSIQEICKERNILKREYMTNLRLGSYVISKLVVQAVVCAVQVLVVVGIFAVFVHGKYLPEKGVFTSIWIEYYITLFLLAFASDTMALVISSLVKNSSTANTFIPIVLIVQIVFSGVLFDMKGVMDIFSNLMVNKWGIAALAASTGLNDAQPSFLVNNPSMQLNLGSSMSTAKDLYASTVGNLLFIWGVLIAFIIVCSLICRFLLIRVKNDKR